MTAIAKKLDARLKRWAPETAKKVKQLVAEIIELADHDVLDLVRSRKVSRKYSTLSMAAKPGEVWLADLGLAAKTRPVVIVPTSRAYGLCSAYHTKSRQPLRNRT